MELLGLEFVGPFPKIHSHEFRWIIVCVSYFSRYVWAEPTEKNDSSTVILFLRKKFSAFGVPVGMYMDYGAHFGKATKDRANSQGIVW